MKRRPLAERFDEKVAWDGECLVWMAGLSQGYGSIGTGDGKVTSAHRVYWMLNRGPIPKGMYVLHNCQRRLRRCVNHTYLGTHQDNMQDAAGAEYKWRPNVWRDGEPYDWTGKRRDGLRGKMIR